MLNELAKQIHENAVSKGFYEGEKNTGELLCLVHSEISEALEADRRGRYYKPQFYFIDELGYNIELIKDIYGFKNEFENAVKNTFEDELADAIIRILDICAFKGIDIESHIKAKIRYNSLREHKHGKKY